MILSRFPTRRVLATCCATMSLLWVAASAQVQFPQYPQFPNQPDTSLDSSSDAQRQSDTTTQGGGAFRLRQSSQDQRNNQQMRIQRQQRLPEYKPGEFELYVQRLVDTTPAAQSEAEAQQNMPSSQEGTNESGRRTDAQAQARKKVIRRLGADLMTPDSATPDAADYTPLIPADYVVQAGDELLLTLWGSVDGDLRLTVDRAGRISVPRVGSVMVAGTRYSELHDVIARRVAQQFKNFQLSVSLGQLRGVRVYVAGFVSRPGAYTVSSLSTVVGALITAGGPSSAGSFRNVQLRRGRELVTTLDLYDLLLKGDRSSDQVVQPDDVIYVGPIETQVAMIGSVNQPAIFELKSGETVADLLRMAGGFTPVADTTRVAVERLDDRADTRINQLDLPQSLTNPVRSGDVLRAFNAVLAVLPVERQNKRVRVEGEVLRPGEYVLPSRTSISDALKAAGGMTSAAFVYGTEFSRESVRLSQQQNYDRALRDLELEFAKSSTTLRTNTADEAAAQTQRSAATSTLIARLRGTRPTGRIVLQIPPDGGQLPELALEDGDRIYVPAKPTTVGVFGSVFNAGSYLWNESRTLDDYMRLAGGPTRGADESSVFVIRANGSVVSNLQSKSWFSTRSSQFVGLRAQPGDTIFVPEEINKTTFIQGAKDWTQILYQFGLGIAGIKAAVR